jgi:hypothetical protein
MRSKSLGAFFMIYPLVNIQKAIENGEVSFPTKIGDFP